MANVGATQMAGPAEVVRAEKQAEAAVGRAERTQAGRDVERARAKALHTTIDELKAGQALSCIAPVN